MYLTHKTRDCTGRWDPAWIGNEFYWSCERCGVVLYHCDRTAGLAIRENELGIMLHQLANAGRKILDAQGSEW